MKTKNMSRFGIVSLGLAALVLGTRANAGVLRVSWNASIDQRTTGYHVYVGSASGEYTRMIDAGVDARATITDLTDEQNSFIMVKAHDVTGADFGAATAEIVSLPRPRVEAIEPRSMRAGTTAMFTITGANFDEASLVRSRDARFTVRSATPAGPGRMIIEVQAASSSSDDLGVDTASFTVINPGRKAETFFVAHPEALDADGDHQVDHQDVRLVQQVFGATQGTDGYSLAADVDGNGVVDGSDLARVIAKNTVVAPSVSVAPSPLAASALTPAAEIVQ